MGLRTIDEKSTAYLTVSFYDKDGELSAPTSATYEVNCLTTGTAVRTATAMSPIATTYTITLNDTDNAIQTSTNEEEIKVVTVEASYGAGDKLNGSFKYKVRNLTGVS